MVKKTGRPRAVISQEEFEKLCGLQCTQVEMCAFFNVDDMTLNRWCKDTYKQSFSEIFAIKRGIGNISLRRKQFNLADKSAAMAIFLGQQYLGQRNYAVLEARADIDVKNIEIDPLSKALDSLTDV